MPNAVQFIRMTGQIHVDLNNTPMLKASRISIRIAKPISKQKSATAVGIAEGIPDPSGNIKIIPQANNPDSLDPQDLVLAEGGGTLVFKWGLKKYQVTGVFFTDASADNDPGVASLDNTVGFEGAIIKRIA